MDVPTHWRSVPAGTVEEVITAALGVFPPTFAELEALAKAHDYDVVYTKLFPVAVTQNEYRVINIPPGNSDRMLADLLHELSEVLLGLPVAAEYHHPPTGQNEHHNVAALTTHRLTKRLHAARVMLGEQIVETEASAVILRAQLRQIATEVQAFAAATESVEGSDLAIPDTSLLARVATELRTQTERLNALQARLRCI